MYITPGLALPQPTAANTAFEGNVIDLRQAHTNGKLYNLKFIRHRGFAGHQSANVAIQNNNVFGASWAIEVESQEGLKSVVRHNTLLAEICGISIASGKDAVINGNTIPACSWLGPVRD